MAINTFNNQGQMYQPQQQFYNPQQTIQPAMNYQNSPVMSIAPVSGEENARQFPLAVGTILYLIDMSSFRLYIKSNSNNPREMRIFDLSEVLPVLQSDVPVTREEFDGLQDKLNQILGALQTNNQQSSRQRYDNNNRRHNNRGGRNNDNTGDVSMADE